MQCIAQSNRGENCKYTGAITQINPIPCNNNPYILIFEDSFDGNELDFSKWKKRNWNLEKKSIVWYQDENVAVENGALKIFIKREFKQDMHVGWDYWHPDTVKDFFFTTGEIESLSKFPIEGKFEARIKLPIADGLNPAFWMYEDNPYNEVDIFEFCTTPDTGHYQNGTWYEYYNNGISAEGTNNAYECNESWNFDDYNNNNFWGQNLYNFLFDNNFRTYTFVWDKDKIEWYINGCLMRSETNYVKKGVLGSIADYLLSWAFDFEFEQCDCNNIKVGDKYNRAKFFPENPMKILLGCGMWTKSPTNLNFNSPVTMEVDYVKVWQRKPCNQNVTVTNIPIFNCYPIGNGVLYNVITGKNVTLNCNMTIPSGYTVKVIAKENIVFGENFNLSVEEGGLFLTENNANLCNIQSNNQVIVYKIIEESERNNDISNEDTSINICYDRKNEIFVYPTLDNDKQIIIDFKTNDYSNLSLTITDKYDRTIYVVEKIEISKKLIDVNDFNIGDYVLHIQVLKNNRELKYQIIINSLNNAEM
ncbi:MAG: glycoside hydrolase family 16 protein [Bacteroidales bacterium]|nr:glycoside hydrolase family 16 protein [Bacteroidales bacterium]